METRHLDQNRFVKSHGFVLLLIVLTLLAISGAILFTNLAAGGARAEQQILRARASSEILLAAKLALIGYVVSSPDKTFRPGIFPAPDSLANNIYDGTEDSKCLGTGPNGLPGVASSSVSKRCLGKFPWKTIGFDLGTVDQNDPIGRVPWLAVSANVVSYDNCLKVLNSDSAALDSPAVAGCPLAGAFPPYTQPLTLPHPWLTVLNENGAQLSNRVVAVLIMPGSPLTTETRTQRRTVAAPGQPADYLDDVRLPLGCVTGCTTYDNAGLSNVFVSIPHDTAYPLTAADASKRGQKVPFNDILIYVTIDEVMAYIERRVVGEMSKSMSVFKATPNVGNYAWLAPFTAAPATSTSFYARPNTFFGIFPFMTDFSNGTSSYYYATDFDWSLPGASETKTPAACIRIQTTPNVYIRRSVESDSFLSSTASPTKGQCQWKGLKTVDCSYVDTPTITRTVNSYSSSANCTSLTAPGSTSITFTRSIQATFLFDTSVCASGAGAIITPLVDVNRWTYTCPAVLAMPNIIAVTDTLTSYNPVTGTQVASPTIGTIVIDAPATPPTAVVISKMRYLPILPNWYIDNLWYKTGFSALAPSFAPTPGTPCGAGVTSLTVGTTTGAQAVVMQAGKYLGGGANPRPSTSITDYLEGNNAIGKGGAAPGMTNCLFTEVSTSPSATMNDQILVVSP